MAQDFRPKSDQPRVQAKDIARGSPAPTIEYRNTPIKSYGNRTAARSNARTERR